MKFLITGGAGFIGSNLVDVLLKDNHSIICVDNFDSFYDPIIKRANIKNALLNNNFKLIEGDICDKEILEECFNGNDIEMVIHLAARAGVRPSILYPELYFEVNVNATLKLLNIMKKYNVKKMVFASSSSVYGNNKKTPFSEYDNVDNPISPYAASKKAAELLCHTYFHLFHFDIFCLRFFTVYGQRQRPEMAIHLFTKNISEENQITLFGDGTSKRDYTYVDDIIKGIQGAINNLKGFEIINLGESNTTSLRDLISLIENGLNKNAIIEWKPTQAGDVDNTFADISKAKKIIGYKPEVPIEKGIEKFIKWYLNNSNITTA